MHQTSNHRQFNAKFSDCFAVSCPLQDFIDVYVSRCLGHDMKVALAVYLKFFTGKHLNEILQVINLHIL